MKSKRSPEKKSTEKKPVEKTKFRVDIALVAGVGGILVVAIVIAIVMFACAQSQGSAGGDSNIGNYLTIFSILITAIAVVLPVTSYVRNI